jgi:hypothetical protein
VTDAGVAVAAQIVVTDLKAAPKAGQKAVVMGAAQSAANVALIHAVQNNVSHANHAVMASVQNVKNAPQASNATMRRAKKTVSHVNPAKVAVPSALAANVVQSVASACRAMLPSKTWPWPTKPPWLQPWANQLAMQASQARTARRKMQDATSAASVVNAMAAVTSVVTTARAQAMQPHPSKTPIWMPQRKLQPSTRVACKTKSNASHANAAAVTVMAAKDVSATKMATVMKNKPKQALKTLF